ncbi:hypothetical protein D3C75_858860 [compost metagenome]
MAGQGAWPLVPAPHAGSAARPPCPGPDYPQFRRQRPGPGQCSHADRPQGHVRVAGAQPQQYHGQQRTDPVPGAQRLVADPAAGDHLHVPGPARRGGPDHGVPAHPAGDQRLDPGRPAVGGGDAAPAPVGPGSACLPDSRCLAAGRLHGLPRHPLGGRAGQPVVDPGQPHVVWRDHPVPGDRRLEAGEGV